MFKNYISTTISGDLNQILFSLGWDEKDEMLQILCKYLPTHLREMLPEQDRVLLIWDSEESFGSLLREPKFIEYNERLSTLGFAIKFTLPGQV